MTMISSTAFPRRRPFFSIAQHALKWVSATAEKRHLRSQRAELSHLPKHLLRDMGLEHYATPHDPLIPPRWR
ncbi:DUF1127 domain-containing protein [Jannaschia sp. CCS1]|uniref:DUF1127 domain-containing protein n=1 Tax=Jannaschia sp. (strain CCS1) TaxID=290400 RepID=UPI00140FA82A|nr:DUF1127 domain-containing protein [Jannaschia sp. CCS1]